MPNFLILPQYKKSETKTRHQNREYKHFNEEKFLQDLANTRIANKMCVQTPTSKKYGVFHEHFTSTLVKFLMGACLSKPELAIKLKPWLTHYWNS